MQQADYRLQWHTPWMQESASIPKSFTPFMHSRTKQAKSEEEEKDRNKDRGQ